MHGPRYVATAEAKVGGRWVRLRREFLYDVTSERALRVLQAEAERQYAVYCPLIINFRLHERYRR